MTNGGGRGPGGGRKIGRCVVCGWGGGCTVTGGDLVGKQEYVEMWLAAPDLGRRERKEGGYSWVRPYLL